MKKNLAECCARKNYQCPLGKTEDPRLYPKSEIGVISGISKTTSTLFQSQEGLPVGACHDLGDMSYDNHTFDRRYIRIVKLSFCSQYYFVSKRYSLKY